MGQQQLMLMILSVIVVGLAIAVGIWIFTANINVTNRDNIIADLNNMGADAFQYKIRPTTLGGGNGTYVGYTIPPAWGSANENASYFVTGTVSSTYIAFHASSKVVEGGTVDIEFDGAGHTEGPVSAGF